MTTQKNISLKPYNTFGIDVYASLFAEVSSIEDLKSTLSKHKDIPHYILGGGSNVLFTKNFDGIVIKNDIKGVEVLKENEEHLWVKFGGGEIWHEAVLHSINQGWAGIENLSLIPGTVGAAPMQNIGAYGVEIKEVFESLEALNKTTLEIETFDKQACQFGYRTSTFKTDKKDQYIICNVTFKLNKKPSFMTEYGDIKNTLKEMNVQELSIRAISDAVIKIRQSKLPDPKVLGNAGSFFKNPEIKTEKYEEIKVAHPHLPGYPSSMAGYTKVAAGWLIDQAGWKGYREGNVGVNKKQALVLVNYGGGTGQQIIDLAKKIQQAVNEKFDILLHPEVNIIA